MFSGKATFRHGARRPVPGKDLITSLALKRPVFLVDEYRISARYHRCGSVMQRGSGLSVFRCTNRQTGENSCSADNIDRDVNAARNIGISTCSSTSPSPHFLQWKSKRNNVVWSIICVSRSHCSRIMRILYSIYFCLSSCLLQAGFYLFTLSVAIRFQ